MGAIIEVASGIMGDAARQMELSAQNIANISTTGYKKRTVAGRKFSQIMNGMVAGSDGQGIVDQSDGKLTTTGNPSSLALSGPGYFLVKGEKFAQYTRGGLFERDDQGHLTFGHDLALQGVDGAELTLAPGPFEVLSDGTVTQGGEAVARIGVFDAARAGISAGRRLSPDVRAEQIETPNVHQGMEEASNVSMGDEMIAIMTSLHRAETGQKLVGVYDELMGRALSAFGQV